MAEEQKQPTAEPQQPAAKAISEPQQPAAQPMESQVTSKTPATRPAKNPKRVEAGKAVAAKTKQAREAKEKALAEAHAEIERYKKKEAAAPPAPEPAQETEPKPAAADSEGFTTNQKLTMLGIGVTLLTTYVKRDDIKNYFAKKKDNPPEPQPKEPAPLPQPPQPRKKGIRKMD